MASSLTLTGFVLKNLQRRRLRTLLTLCGIGMAVGAFVALVGFSRSLEQQWMQIYSASGTDLTVVQGTFLNTSMDEGAAAKLAALPDVAAVAPIIFNIMDLTSDVNALAYAWTSNSYEFGSLKILSGRSFRDGQPEAMLGDLLAQHLKMKVGDSLQIQGTKFTITGTFHGQSALQDDAILMPLDQLQILSSLQGKVSTIDIRLRPAPKGESAEQYIKHAQSEIDAAIPGLTAIPAAERAGNNQFVRVAQASAWGTSCLAIIIGILGIANTMVMSVFERTKEIGILRALGWKKWQILALILFEAVALGLGGGIFGILIGLSALQILAILPETSGFVSASIHWPLMIEAMAIATFSGLIAGAVPAMRAGRLSPVDALHHD